MLYLTDNAVGVLCPSRATFPSSRRSSCSSCLGNTVLYITAAILPKVDHVKTELNTVLSVLSVLVVQ